MTAAPKDATRATVTANREAVARCEIKLDGDQSVLATLAGLMDEFDPDFNIVTP